MWSEISHTYMNIYIYVLNENFNFYGNSYMCPCAESVVYEDRFYIVTPIDIILAQVCVRTLIYTFVMLYVVLYPEKKCVYEAVLLCS